MTITGLNEVTLRGGEEGEGGGCFFGGEDLVSSRRDGGRRFAGYWGTALGTFLALGDFFHERRREKCVVSDPVE